MSAQVGFQVASQLLRQMASQSPKNKKIINYLLSQGLSEDDIANYLSGQGLSESEKSDVGRKITANKRVGTFLDVLKTAVPVVAGGYATYRMMRNASPIIQQVLGGGGSPTPGGSPGGGIANAILGSILGGQGTPQQGAPSPASPTSSGSPGQPVITPTQDGSLARSSLGLPEQEEEDGLGSMAKTFLNATVKPALAKPGALKDMVKGVASLFGFKNKTLVNAVADLAEATGKDVKQLYNELSKQDISTPEKAINVVKSKLAEVVEGYKMGGKDFTAKTVAETNKALKKDLASSVIKKTEYNKDRDELRVIFNNNHTYMYEDVPEEVYQNLTKGGTPAKTKGENEFGMWWVGKKPSLGATFNQLIKKGGYGYKRIEDYEPSEEEDEEYKALAEAGKEAYKEFQSGLTKTRSAAEKVAKPRKPLTATQRKAREMLLEKQLANLRGKPREQKDKGIEEAIEKRLKTLQDLDKLAASKKAKVLTQENIRFEKKQGEDIIKKMIVLLPPKIAKAIKDKIGNMEEKEILKLIKSMLPR